MKSVLEEEMLGERMGVDLKSSFKKEALRERRRNPLKLPFTEEVLGRGGEAFCAFQNCKGKGDLSCIQDFSRL